jgi:predicted aconitase
MAPRSAARAYENLTASARDPDVDFIMLGCPHNSIEQMWLIASLLDGRKVSAYTRLWMHTPSAIRQVADRSGSTRIIEDAGGVVMSDTCPPSPASCPRAPASPPPIPPSRPTTSPL